MEELRPLTISRSIKDAPTVLLTESKAPYLLYVPLNEHIIIQDTLLRLMCEHFKINRFRTGYFTLKNKKYYCVEEIQGVVDFSPWEEHLWLNKRRFNQFLKPSDFFKMMLIELFFPIFGGTLRKSIIPGVKNQAMLVPTSPGQSHAIQFEPTTLSKLQLNHPALRRFFSFCKEDIREAIVGFNLLNHDKFMMDLKYQLSFYPNWRNVYWDELKKCNDNTFLTYTSHVVWDYFHRLGTK